MTTTITTISISPEFADLAKKHHLSWSEASRIGMSIMLADLGEREYDNKLNLYRKMQFFKTRAEEALQQIEDYEQKIKRMEKMREEEEKKINELNKEEENLLNPIYPEFAQT